MPPEEEGGEDPCDEVEEDEALPPVSWASVIPSVNKARTSEAQQIREIKTREGTESMDKRIFPRATLYGSISKPNQ